MVHRHPPLSGLTTGVGRLLRRHALTLFVRLRFRRLRFDSSGVTGFRVCLHALSSFQRTDISKRPRRFAHARVSLRPFGRRRRTQLPTASGELSEFTIAALACQLLFASISNFLFEARRSRPNRLGREAL